MAANTLADGRVADEAKPTETTTATTTNETPDAPRSKQWTVPAWLNHFNASDLKTLLRCCAAAWVAMLLIFIDPTLQNIGQSTFFGAIVLFIVPPAGILMIYLLASFSLLIGMCLAWAWGLLTMKAAMAARSPAETQAKLQALQNQTAAIVQQTGQNATAVATKLIYDGSMLDTRVVVIYYVMCCVFIYFLARLRYANEKLILLQLFGTMTIDIFLLIGPTLRFFVNTLPQVLVKPGAIGIGIGAACCLLIFPQSTSYVVLSQVETLLRMLETPLDSARGYLDDSRTMDPGHLGKAKDGIIGMYRAIAPSVAFLPLDISRGRWDADDVKGLHGKIRDATATSLSLLEFHIARITSIQKSRGAESAQSDTTSSVATSDEKGSGKTKPTGHTRRQKSSETSALIEALKTPETNAVSSGTLQTLANATSEALSVSSESLKLAADCIHVVNTNRWYVSSSCRSKLDEISQRLAETVSKLRLAKGTCVQMTTDAVLNTHSDLYDENGALKDPDNFEPHSLAGVILSMVVEDRIVVNCDSIEAILEHILHLMRTRTKERFWLPTRLRYAFSWLSSGKASTSVTGASTEDVDDPDKAMDQMKEARRRLRIVRKGQGVPKPRRGLVTTLVVGTYRWLTSPGGMYALRMVVVTIATAIPASLPHTAGFFYREKGIWAVITAQTCMLMYMADFTFSLVSRLLGTLIGGVIALAAWYAGSGNGNGNPYGLGATTALSVIILMWLRIFLPPAYMQASVMAAATFALIIGFSYDQHHYVQYGLPGIGYVAFWKRLVTVLLGFVAAFIVQMLPKPPSATSHVSKTLANTVRTLADHYALLLSHWGGRHTRAPDLSGASTVAGQISLNVAETLMSLNSAIAVLKVEVSMLPFDQKCLQAVQHECHTMNLALGRLLVLSTSLPKELQDRLANRTGLLNDVSVGNVMSVLVIIEQSLRSGAPLPERLPGPLVHSCVAAWTEQHRTAELNKDLVQSDDYRRFCVALSSCLMFLSAVDELVVVLKQGLGERHVVHEWDENV
ncbi:hypothetical protein K4F52_008042 [Lecanicillium sp. MT-2017a]|nr:hypothetical protein K4F52_008042 [Lecanicillium sp. MT-2017a]